MTEEQKVGIVQKIIQEIKLEPVYREGKLIKLETLSQELRLYIVKLVAGAAFYQSKIEYLRKIEEVAKKEGIKSIYSWIIDKKSCKESLSFTKYNFSVITG